MLCTFNVHGVWELRMPRVCAQSRRCTHLGASANVAGGCAPWCGHLGRTVACEFGTHWVFGWSLKFEPKTRLDRRQGFPFLFVACSECPCWRTKVSQVFGVVQTHRPKPREATGFLGFKSLWVLRWEFRQALKTQSNLHWFFRVPQELLEAEKHMKPRAGNTKKS